MVAWWCWWWVELRALSCVIGWGARLGCTGGMEADVVVHALVRLVLVASFCSALLFGPLACPSSRAFPSRHFPQYTVVLAILVIGGHLQRANSRSRHTLQI